jgi:hypothetical protein
MAKSSQRELHKGIFHLVHAKMNLQWWICAGRGGVSTWSILSKHDTRAEALKVWKHMHRLDGEAVS